MGKDELRRRQAELRAKMSLPAHWCEFHEREKVVYNAKGWRRCPGCQRMWWRMNNRKRAGKWDADLGRRERSPLGSALSNPKRLVHGRRTPARFPGG
jgi:hypothetical protein